MDETPQGLTITDLPNEVLEMLVPDRQPKTISTLKMVNKRFYQLMSNDRYFKEYLFYQENYLLCAIKSEKNSGKEIIEKIKREDISKWKGYLTLEKLYFKNWSCGSISHCEKVPLLEVDQYGSVGQGNFWRELVDKDGEHWLLSSFCSRNSDGFIVLMNITNEPKIYIERTVTPKNVELLLHGQVMCLSYTTPTIDIHNIINVDGVIKLEYNFNFSLDPNSQWTVVSSHGKNIFVSIPHFSIRFDGLIHFRDLQTGEVLKDVQLWEYECLKRFRNLPDEKLVVTLNEDDTTHGNDVQFPYVVFLMKDKLAGEDVAVVFNVEHMKPTTFLDISGINLSDLKLTDNIIYFFSNKGHEYGQEYFSRVHSLSLEQRGEVDRLETPKLLFNSTTPLYVPFPLSIKNAPSICALAECDHYNELHILTLAESEITDENISLDGIGDHISETYMIKPNVLVVTTCDIVRNARSAIKIIKITKKEQDLVVEEVIDWSQTLTDNDITFSHPKFLLGANDLTKCVIYDESISAKNSLAIFYF